MAKRSAFGKQFAAARAAGAKDFSFGGKSYSTKVAGEGRPAERGAKTTTLRKNTTAIPQPRPAASSLPATTTAVPASAAGARIQKMADDVIKHPMQADPKVVAQINASLKQPRSVTTTRVAAQKGDRVRKSSSVASNDQHDYSRLNFFK